MANRPAGMLSEAEIERLATLEATDETRDVISEMELCLQQVRSGNLDRRQAALKALQNASNLRLKTRAANIPGLHPLTHRMEDYLVGIERLDDGNVDDLQRFIDRIAAVIEGEHVPADDVAIVVRSLPAKKAFDVNEVTITEIEMTLVMPQRSAARVVERELANCGYRVSTVLDAFEALELIVDTRPDLVITAMVMPRLTGVDLACALRAMPSTHNIAVAVLTSLDPHHADLAALPMNVGLIRRGPQFGDDLAMVLQRFGIT